MQPTHLEDPTRQEKADAEVIAELTDQLSAAQAEIATLKEVVEARDNYVDELKAEIERLRKECDANDVMAVRAINARDALQTKLTALRMAVECLVEEIEHVVGTAALADTMFAIEASRT